MRNRLARDGVSAVTDRVEGRPLEEAELIELAKDGDVQAYGELVTRYRELAFRTAFLITRSAADAEDAAQDAFVKAYYALERFRSGDAAPSPEAAALEVEAKEALLRALGGLKENDRLIIAYRYFLELSEAETAQALGIRPGTVKSRLSRALDRLRDQLPAEREASLPMEATDG